MSLTILKTKLIIPFIHSHLVRRSRLSEQIDLGIKEGHKLTLVAAPAGFGKSTAVSVWAHQGQRPIAWFTLEDSDNELTVFWIYVIAAIRTIFPDFAEPIYSALTNSPPAPIKNLLPAIVNELASLGEPLTLVLDDYHVIENQEIHDSLAFVLDHHPQNFHLMISTRVDAPLTIGRLRAQRQLTELRAQDLRFTHQEAQIFLNEIMGLGLTQEDVKLLEMRTEGWGVGLLLAAQSIQGRNDKSEFISAFSGSQQYILEYLVEEVLSQQPDIQRNFLLQTSILDKFCSSLCNAVTGENNSDETIQQLNKNNLFVIPLDQNHIWYRYHHLFADLLSIFLHREYSEEDIHKLHRRASRWFQENKDLSQAVKYAISGHDFNQAADLIEEIVDQVIARGNVRTLLKWLAEIPEEVIKSRPKLLMHQGWTIFLSGRVTQASSILHKAKENLASVENRPQHDLLNGQLSALLATITALTRNIDEAISQAKEALSHLPESEFNYRARAARAWGVCCVFQGNLEQGIEKLTQAKGFAAQAQNKFLTAEILSQLATVRKHQGKFTSAAKTYQQILELYEKPDQAPPACLGYIGLADIVLERNNLETAEDYLNTGIELSKKGNIGYALQPAYLIGGLLKCALGDRQAAFETIKKGENLSRIGGGSFESVLGLTWFQVRINLLCGEIDKAKQWAEGNLLPPGWSFDGMPIVLDEMHQSLIARASLHNGDYQQVLEIFDRVCDQAENGGRLSRVIELNLFKAVALKELGRVDEAITAFEKSLNLAAPEGIIRLFLEVGTSAVEIYRMLNVEARDGQYYKKLEASFEAQYGELKNQQSSSEANSLLIEPLTGREQEVLRLICEGYSNSQIADELIVSVNTVKKHTSNIYNKLGVRNRAQAVIYVKEHGLI